jgi:hypothetical protein
MSNLRPFTHRIYVDFSGDDGDPRTPGASRCLCIAWVASAESELSHNKGVVLQIKKIIGCRKSDNLKYKKLKRHRFKDKALALLTQLRVIVVIVPVLKERITDQELRSPRTKKLVDLIHYFPLSVLIKHVMQTYADIYFQLVFDRVGWRGCEEEIRSAFRQDAELDWKHARPDWLLFTKSGSNLMLQLADIVAGLGHEYIDSLQGMKLPPCTVCAVKGKPERMCQYRRGKRVLPGGGLIGLIYPLLIKNEQGKSWEHGFLVRPPAVCREYMFIDCIFGEV